MSPSCSRASYSEQGDGLYYGFDALSTYGIIIFVTTHRSFYFRVLSLYFEIITCIMILNKQ